MQGNEKIFTILVMLVAMNASGQWQPDVRLTNASGSSSTSSNNAWCIAANGNIVHTVWSDDRDGNHEIYYKRSTDDGTNWGVDLRLTNDNAESGSPSIAVSGTFVHVVWVDNRLGIDEIYYKRSTDGGINWGVESRLSPNDSLGSSIPSISVSGTYVHVVWEDLRNYNWGIYYKRSTDGGINWDADIRLSIDISSSALPSIATSGSIVNVVWQDYFNGIPGIYHKRSSDGGMNWGNIASLTNNTFRSDYPSIAVSGSTVHVVWPDVHDINYEIYYLRSTDGGLNWGTHTRLTNNTHTSWNPSIAVSSSLVHVVWQEERDGNKEIYYKRSTDGGINWGTDTRLTNNSAMSYNPSIAVSGSFAHVLWHDNRDSGNWEIYYKRNPTGNVGIKNISSEVPSRYSLGQNYPNPFNSTSNLKFEISNTGDVKLIVYDIMGKEVQTLVNERLQPGTYEAAFDGSMLNSGVYFYKLMTDGFTETKKCY